MIGKDYGMSWRDALGKTTVLQGISLDFFLFWFVPLLLVTIPVALFSRIHLAKKGIVLTIMWGIACVPALFFFSMGHAFGSSHNSHPIVQFLTFFSVGAILIWSILVLVTRAKSFLLGKDAQ